MKNISPPDQETTADGVVSADIRAVLAGLADSKFVVVWMDADGGMNIFHCDTAEQMEEWLRHGSKRIKH